MSNPTSSSTTSRPSRLAGTQPDIVFIVADDLGYADLGCYGGRQADFGAVVPHIDALAAHGMRFTRGYANSPVCSPTRFALMTGRWQYRLRGAAEEPINSASRGSSTLGLPPAHPTIASLLRGVGYRTALVGKWHLGYPPHFGPLRSGYDEFYGPTSGGVDYFSHCSNAGVHDLWEGEEERQDAGYLTDLLSDRAVRVARQTAEDPRPLLLSLHYTAPHRTGPGRRATTPMCPRRSGRVCSISTAATSTPSLATGDPPGALEEAQRGMAVNPDYALGVIMRDGRQVAQCVELPSRSGLTPACAPSTPLR